MQIHRQAHLLAQLALKSLHVQCIVSRNKSN
uniref:Uncharacterized protein n=1 Tax=Anguilla anguilla TaxID=7936 RepID=A0A0E9UJ85_ANGAN